MGKYCEKKREKCGWKKKTGFPNTRIVVENSHVINRIVQKEETSEKVWKRDRVDDVRNERKQRSVTRLSFVVDRENIDVVNPRTVSVGPR